MKLAFLCAVSTLAILCSICAFPWLVAVGAALIVFVLAAFFLREGTRWELLACVPFLPLLFLYLAAPGADAAMYAAQARALLDGSGDISAAYPGVRAAMYPRGFPALIALFTPLTGIAKASLCASVCAYAGFVLALAQSLRRFVRPGFALAASIAIVCISRYVPISAFSWGGSSSVLACALAVYALDTENKLAASLLLAGAFATHPIGAIAGLASAPLFLFDWRATDRESAKAVSGSQRRRALIPCLAVAPLIFCFHQFGPTISPAETAWIARWQASDARLVQDHLRFFPLDYLSAFSRECGDAFAIAVYLSVLAAIWFRELRRPAMLAAAGLVYVGLLMGLGPRAPWLGTFVYPDRLPPLWLFFSAPILAVTASRIRLRILVPAALALAVSTHLGWSLGEPLLTRDDLAIAPCIAQVVPKGESIVASYGQGGQWLPALIDRPITQAHVHISLYDEVRAQRPQMRSQFQFLSTHEAQYTPALAVLPAAKTLCESGGAKLVRLQERAAAEPGPF